MMMAALAALITAGSLAGPLQPPPPQQSSPAGVIRGHVLRSDGRPLPRAHVLLGATGEPRLPTTTDADDQGRYEFTKLPPGRYRVTASKGGYTTMDFGQRRATAAGETIQLRPAEVRERVDITLPHTSAIAGRILDEFGEPVEGAMVRVSQIGYVGGRRRLVEAPGVLPRRTNDIGRFRVFGLQPGRYVVSATIGQVTPFSTAVALPGYAVTYFPGTSNAAEAQFITVAAASDATTLEFALARAPTARVAGVASTSEGEPITGGLLLVPTRRSNVVAAAPAGARISPDGSFEFPNVAPGEYVVQAYRGRMNVSTEGEFASQIVTMNGSDVTGLVLRTSPGSTIAGSITFESDATPRAAEVELSPLPVDADLAPVASGPPARASIHDDWTFDLAGISGPRRLRLTCAPAGWSLKSIVVNGVDVTDAPLPFGTSDQSLKDVQVMLTDRITMVTGTASDAENRSAFDVHIVAFAPERDTWYPASRFLAHTTTQPDGSFSIRGLPPGTYLVAAVDRLSGTSEDGEWQDAEVLESLAPHATRVTLGDAQSTSVSLKVIAR